MAASLFPVSRLWALGCLLVLPLSAQASMDGLQFGSEFGSAAEAQIQARFEVFVDFMKLPCQKVRIDYFDDALGNRVRGLAAKEDLDMGEKILSIPAKYTLSKFSAAGTPLQALLETLEGILPDKAVMALVLLYHFDLAGTDATASKLAPYMDSLPTRLTNLLYFTPEELRELQCPAKSCAVVQRVEKARLELWEIFSVLRQHLDSTPAVHIFAGGNDVLTWDSFVWAYSVVESRSFKINVTDSHAYSLVPHGYASESKPSATVDPRGSIQFLVPFADLFNHHNAFPALQYSYGVNDTSATIDFFADQDYKAGDQVFISYGLQTNSDTLLHYGFVMPDNIYESVGFAVELDSAESDPLHDQKQKIWKTLQLDGIANPNIPLSGEPPDTLWTLLRLKFAVAEDFEAARNAQSSAHAPNGFFFDPSNATNIGSSRLEFDIVQGLLDNVEELLKQYPTSLEEDVILLSKEQDKIQDLEAANDRGADVAEAASASQRFQLALVLRIEIKRILRATVLHCLKSLADHFEITARPLSNFAHDRPKDVLVQDGVGEDESKPPSSADPAGGIERAMWEHWQRGMQAWRRQWAQWKQEVDSIWGAKSSRNAQHGTLGDAFAAEAMLSGGGGVVGLGNTILESLSAPTTQASSP